MQAISNLKTLRRNLGLSRETMAHHLGVSLYTVYRWEKGRVNPSALARRELALFLYNQGALALGEARRLSGLFKRDFLTLLTERNIPRHYTAEDLEDDLQFVEKWAS